MSTTPGLPPPGWYASPVDASRLQYWDGTGWTQHSAPRQIAPPPQQAPAPQQAPPPAQVPPVPAPPVQELPPMQGPPLHAPLHAQVSTPGYDYAQGPGYAYAQGPAQAQSPAYGSSTRFGGPPAPAASPWTMPQLGYMITPRKVGFRDAVVRGVKGWTDYRSRATVGEYWWFQLFSILAAFGFFVVVGVLIALMFGGSTGDGSTGGAALLVILELAAYAFFIATNLPLSVRRLHDCDRTGWWYLIGFVPLGGFVLLYFFIQSGTAGPNRYGPVPQ